MKIKIYETLQNIFRRYRNSSENDISYESIKTIIKNDSGAVLLDVRSPQEYKEGHLNGSINIPLYDLEQECTKILNKKDNTIIVYCQTGHRSKKALEILEKEGYENLYNLIGGLDNM